MTHLKVRDVVSGDEEEVQANGLFYAVGHDPATALFKGQVEADAEGYIITKPGTSYTNIDGVFAAGDVQDKRYRQAITSAGTCYHFLFSLQSLFVPIARCGGGAQVDLISFC